MKKQRPAPKTPAQRKREERQRQRDKGLVSVNVWIKPSHKEALLQYAEGLNKKHE